jgi:serine/threonine-protein kinase
VGRHAEAIDAFRQLARLEGVDADEIAGLGHAYAAAGRVEDARRVLARLEERARRTFLSVHAIAVIHVALGEHERALDWLERGFEERDRALVWLRVHPRLDPLRGQPRLDALIRRMKLA